ncbi:Glycosyltransferase sugar-binding region containing DXD motif protein [uncultured archaeon]|nr:Glycosyltransferase sugar-binding region containing DXD motif protein [uncultured archaeon]
MADSIIPNQFHFIFGLQEQKEPFHLVHYLCIESCRQVNQPDKIYFYYHFKPYGRYWDMIKKHLTLQYVDLNPIISDFSYRGKNRSCKKYRYAHHSDFIRLQKLIELGGIYADIDTIFVNKFPDYLFTKQFVLGRENDIFVAKSYIKSPSLCNALIMSQKDSEFGKKWLETMSKEFNGSWNNHSTLLPQKLSQRFPSLIHIEPSRTFYKHMWTRKGISTLFEEYDRDFNGVISMHLWSHLWWSKKRKDFSSFHGGLMTEDYIRNIDTTYNIIARRFLPQDNEIFNWHGINNMP